MKNTYKSPEFDMVTFSDDLVLTASTNVPDNPPAKDDQPITLPFIPAP